MGPHYLNRIFTPQSIAIIGASERENALGQIVLANLLDAGFKGPVYPVNPKHKTIQGLTAFPDIESIGKPVELAVITTPAKTIPALLRHCGENGVRAAVILSAGFGESGPGGKRLQEEVVELSREFDLRIIGPNCLGVMRPSRGINATFSKNRAIPGKLALVSQSGAICTAILDWAESEQIGFSAVASLGDACDVDFGDVLDYLALDRETRSILLYVEGIQNARRFMSGLRAAARMKPVIVIKAGRHAEGSKAAMSHTGALVGADDVFDAALERAGAVRATTIQQLFSAARILSSGYRVSGNRLAIITNAGGPGVMATDRAVELGLAIAPLSEQSIDALDGVLPEHWSHGNPIDILGDAEPARYEKAIEVCLADDGVDATIVLLTPQAMTDPLGAAQVVTKATASAEKPVIACWMGKGQVAKAREHFTQEHLPQFTTPEAGVEAFSYLAAHQRNQRLLLQVPSPLTDRNGTDIKSARLIIEGALSDGRKVLSTMESKAVLNAFRIPVTQTARATTAGEALVAAGTVGYPVAMKIDSPDISHKSDVQGVRLNISSAESVRSAFQSMVETAQRIRPDARITGVTIESMHKSTHGRELMVGVIRDPAFGPVISFGSGGTSVEILKDRAVALPPLNEVIIEGMIARTRVAAMLEQFRNMPAVDKEALERVLLRVSEMVCELPEIQELDINPLIADERGLAAVDARISVDYPPSMPDRYAHMAIHPYPAQLVKQWQLADGTNLTIRPIRPEDAEIEQQFVRDLSAESRYFRFMQAVHELTPHMLVRFTQIDYDREMALIAVREQPDGSELQVAVARYTANPDQLSCEFAITVADDWTQKGIGSYLMNELMDVARSRGLRTVEGEVLTQNTNMLALMRRLGFKVQNSPEDEGIKKVFKRL